MEEHIMELNQKVRLLEEKLDIAVDMLRHISNTSDDNPRIAKLSEEALLQITRREK